MYTKLSILFLFLSSFSLIESTKQTPLVDAQGNSYPTVKIGNQVWMAQNLRSSKGKNGESLNAISSNNPKFGTLYDWKSACKVCPEGWHLPSLAEYEELVKFYGGKSSAGEKMKAADASGFVKFSSINDFKGYAAGVGHPDTRKINFRAYEVWDHGRAYFWTSTESDALNARYVQLVSNIAEVRLNNNLKTGYQSVRCLKNQ